MNHHDSDILEHLPNAQLSECQKALRVTMRVGMGRYMPMYQLLREPTRLEDLDCDHYYEVSIWRNNQTLLCVSPDMTEARYQHRFVCFDIDRVGQSTLQCAIFGQTDEAIAETATWL